MSDTQSQEESGLEPEWNWDTQYNMYKYAFGMASKSSDCCQKR